MRPSPSVVGSSGQRCPASLLPTTHTVGQHHAPHAAAAHLAHVPKRINLILRTALTRPEAPRDAGEPRMAAPPDYYVSSIEDMAGALESFEAAPLASLSEEEAAASVSGEAPLDSTALPASQSEEEENNPYTQADALSIIPSDALIGEPELEALLAEGGRDLSVERICRIFPFPLDGFQKKVRL